MRRLMPNFSDRATSFGVVRTTYTATSSPGIADHAYCVVFLEKKTHLRMDPNPIHTRSTMVISTLLCIDLENRALLENLPWERLGRALTPFYHYANVIWQ